MASTILADKVYTGKKVLNKQLISCEGGKIKSLGPANGNIPSTHVQNICAGLNDIHINGGKELYLTKTPDTNAVHDIAFSCEEMGTAYSLPTLITSPAETMWSGIEAVRKYMEDHPQSGVLGIHLEGPFLNPEKRGAHLPEFLRTPTDAILQEIISRGNGVVRLMTIAPEMFTKKQLQMLLDSDITIAAGHSNATLEQAQAAFDAGIRLVTHLYNAMSGLNHRNPGLVGACFANDEVYAPIILDGFHCHYAAATIAHKIKKDKLLLISDALFLGEHVKHFEWGNYNAYLRDGRYINTENNLSGSTISLADAVRNGVKIVKLDIQEAIEMATIRPAEALGLENRMGQIAEGFPAVFTVFDDDLSEFRVLRL